MFCVLVVEINRLICCDQKNFPRLAATRLFRFRLIVSLTIHDYFGLVMAGLGRMVLGGLVHGTSL